MSEINKKVLMDYIKNRKSELEQACKNHTGHHKRHLTGQHSALVDIEHMIEEGILDVPENPSLITTIESQKEYWEGYSEESIRIESQLRDQIQSQKEEIKRLQDELQRFKYRPTKDQAKKLGLIQEGDK